MINLCNRPDTSISYGGYGNSNAHDENFSTYCGFSIATSLPSAPTVSASVSVSWTFNGAKKVKQIDYQVYYSGYASSGASYNYCSYNGYLYITDNGSTVYLEYDSYAAQANWSRSVGGGTHKTVTNGGVGWSSVTNCVAGGSVFAQRGCGGAEGGGEGGSGYIYEVEVWSAASGSYATII